MWPLPRAARLIMNPRHYRDMIIRAVSEPDGKTLDLIVSHVIDAERAKQILRANGYGMTGLSASATAALVPTVSTRTHVAEPHGCGPAGHAGTMRVGVVDGAFLQAVREWDALRATAAVPLIPRQNP